MYCTRTHDLAAPHCHNYVQVHTGYSHPLTNNHQGHASHKQEHSTKSQSMQSCHFARWDRQHYHKLGIYWECATTCLKIYMKVSESEWSSQTRGFSYLQEISAWKNNNVLGNDRYLTFVQYHEMPATINVSGTLLGTRHNMSAMV